MIVGVPRETKVDEYRVGLVPAGVKALVDAGHEVWVEAGAGAGAGIQDAEYAAAGARLVSREQAWAAQLLVKVKEPQPEEYRFLRPDQVLFSYLHLAAEPELARVLVAAGAVAIGYETVETDDGRLPLLAPMSEVAGRLSVQLGAAYLQRNYGGRGVLLGAVPGVAPGRVVIIGAGVVGSHAARLAQALGADVTVLDVSVERLRRLAEVMGSTIKTVVANEYTVAEAVAAADLLIGAVLVPGARAPRVVTREMVAGMVPGTVVVDVSIDQGGCIETSRPTTHANPTYVVEGVIHYCVTNIPALVPRTSTFALTNATFPYVLALANLGWEQATAQDRSLARGVNVCRGKVVHAAVASALDVARPADASPLRL